MEISSSQVHEANIRRARRDWHEALGAQTALEQIIRSDPELVTQEMRAELDRRREATWEAYEFLSALLQSSESSSSDS